MKTEIKNYIGGKWLPAQGGEWLENFDPSIGEVYSQVPDSDFNDVSAAVAAAESARKRWAASSVYQRSEVLRKISHLIEKKLNELAHAESVDSGKPLNLATKLDIPRAAENFQFFAEAITQVQDEKFVTEGVATNSVLRHPLGVVGCISPWNLPLYLFTWKIAPALAAGNCVVAKPSEMTPMTAFMLTELCAEAGLPDGVLNVVHGLGPKVGGAMSAHPDIGAISFTGSTKTGAEISRVAAPLFKKLSLELGGKNPTVVFADCDFEQAVAGATRSAFLNQGQICLCGSRILVERPIYSKFRDALVERVRSLKVGDPLDESTDQGALVSRQHFKKVMHCVEVAHKEGGKFLVGGRAFQPSGRCAQGWFVLPTLIEGLDESCQTNQEEIFGPVATIQSFDSEEEALRLANSTRYGLAASVWSSDLKRAERVAGLIDSGIVWINCWMVRDLRTPFGGMKDSGVGREGGNYALNFFTELKNVCVKS